MAEVHASRIADALEDVVEQLSYIGSRMDDENASKRIESGLESVADGLRAIAEAIKYHE